MIRRTEKTERYTMIDNALIEDRRLSPKARFVMIYVLHLPDDWRFSFGGLMAVTGMNREALRNAINELKAFGYLHVRQICTGEQGTPFQYEYDWLEKPDIRDVNARKSDIGKSDIGKSDIGKPDVRKPDIGKPDVRKADVGKPDVRKADVRKADVGKPAPILSTDLPNTDLQITDLPKKKKESAPAPEMYGSYRNIPLSREELEALRAEFPQDLDARIERMSEYCAASGKRYQNYAAAIRNWARREPPKPQPRHRRTQEERDDPNYELF